MLLVHSYIITFPLQHGTCNYIWYSTYNYSQADLQHFTITHSSHMIFGHRACTYSIHVVTYVQHLVSCHIASLSLLMVMAANAVTV